MKIEQDPLIRRLFDLAGQEAVGEDFIADVMARIEALRRRTIILWGCVVLVLVGVAWFFTPAVIDTVDMLSQVLPQPVFEWTAQESFISRRLAPMNAIAVPVAILFLLVRKIYRLFF
jgi:hypothetical protein